MNIYLKLKTSPLGEVVLIKYFIGRLNFLVTITKQFAKNLRKCIRKNTLC